MTTTTRTLRPLGRFEITQCRDGDRRAHAHTASDAHRIAKAWLTPGARQITITATGRDNPTHWATRHYIWTDRALIHITQWSTWHGDTYQGTHIAPPA